MSYDEPRGPWYLLTGIIIGIALGVLYSRYFQPVEYVDTTPASLRQDFKDQYRALIAAAYLSNGDLIRARARLELLEDTDTFRALTEQAQQTLARDGASAEARALGMLAIALGQAPPGPGQVITQAPRIATGTPALSTPADLVGPLQANQLATAIEPTIPSTTESGENAGSTAVVSTAVPNATATQVLLEGYVLLGREEVCEQKLAAPLIQVEVNDQSGEPTPGVPVIITWAGGEERFFTGLKPEKGLGYADFTLNPDFVYSLRLGEGGAPLGNLSALACTGAEGESYWGAVLLKFGQP
jgi:hypothetical protein